MEAIVALSIAAAVVQFVDFSTRLVSKGQQYYQSADGALAENSEMEEASKRLQVLTEPLLGLQEDGAVAAICKGCIDVSKELVAHLDMLKVPSTHSHRRWKSFRQALKSTTSKEKIKEIKQRLGDLRAELETHVVLNLRAKLSILTLRHDERFDALDSSTQKIMENLLNLRRTVREDMGNQFEHLIRTEHLEHSKTRAVLSKHSKPQLELRVKRTILESLRFPTRTVRHETIPDAHQRTFEWIFRDPDPDGKPWSNFSLWLESGSGFYWINGKAGSGKSTLMKFIVDHKTTNERLSTWALEGNLETPLFFFWKSGDPDQRSQAGLLRSLLCEVLENHMDIIPGIFPDAWKSGCELAESEIAITFGSWTLTRLKHAFNRLIDMSSERLRLCFFIDGLDEYDGDYDEIAEYFSAFSTYPFVKLCVSSRPWPAFKHAFGCNYQLRLHDLTLMDVRRYVEDKVNGNDKMHLLKQRYPKRTSDLIESLVSKADGVFLWVTLVVKSLLKGLSHNNSLEILERRLNVMPPDLENLYGHMLSSIEPLEMEEGSKVFRLFYALDSVYQTPDIEHIYRALTGTIQDALHWPGPKTGGDTDCSHNEASAPILHEMEIILQSRCGGLIEIHIHKETEYDRASGNLSYIHRTARDYINQPEVWKSILRQSVERDSSWVPELMLLMSSVLCLKTLKFPGCLNKHRLKSYLRKHWSFTNRTLRGLDVDQCSQDSIAVLVSLLDEFNKSATSIGPWIGGNLVIEYWIDKLESLPFRHEDFSSIATTYAIWFYAKNKLEEEQSLQSTRDTPLLAYAMLGSFETNSFANNMKMIEVLMEFAVDPNEQFKGHSWWQYWVNILHLLESGASYKEGVEMYMDNIVNITATMLSRGADLQVCCLQDGSWIDTVTDSWYEEDEYFTAFGYTTAAVSEHSAEFWKEPDETFHKTPVIFRGKEHLPFEERHSLKAVIADAFKTEADPHGADELLELIGKLEKGQATAKSTVQLISHTDGQKRKKKRKNWARASLLMNRQPTESSN